MVRAIVWVLVCDASRARLFRAHPDDQLEQIEELEHPASRARVRDLMADAHGRKPNGQPGHRTNHRPGAEPDTDPKEVEATKFARELADRLEKGRQERSFDRLVLVAPPHFLGLLRTMLDEHAQKQIVLELGKDLTGLKAHDLRERLSLGRLAASRP